MLPPEYMAGIADASEELASKLHSDIMKRIIERMMARAGRGEDYMLTATDKWNIESMQQAGYLYQDILLELSKFTGQSEEIVKQAMLDAGVQALDNDQKIYEKAGIPELDKLSDRYRAMIEADYTACNGSIYNLTRTTADVAQRTFINECDSIYLAVTRGYDSYTNAIAKAVERISEADGIYVTYPSGKRTSVEAAVSRCVRTGVAQMAGHISEQRAKDVGCEHFLVSSHLGARPSHAEWQGKVFKIHGSDKKYQNFKETTGYGTGAGLCGWNCRHSFSPFFPEFMENNQEQYDVKENEEEYNRRQEEKREKRKKRDAERKKLAYKTASECEGVPKDVKKVLEESISCQNSKESIAKDGHRSIIDIRNMANGMRKSPFIILDEEQINTINRYADELKIPRDVLNYNTGLQTGFSDSKNIINIRGDIFPDTESHNNRDSLSEKAVLAHEYYGHMKNHPSNFAVGDWRDEFRASYCAAINTPNLSDKERRQLMLDAYDRAKEAGVKVVYNKEARRIIYGYDPE